MKAIKIQLPEEVLSAIRNPFKTEEEVLKEAIVLELYREGILSSGKAAELLNMERFEFIRYASDKGIPYLRMTKEELEEELKVLEKL